MNDKVILTDCDGVLLEWVHSFKLWMSEQGFIMRDKPGTSYYLEEDYGINRHEGKKLIRQFNESAAIGFLSPYLDSIRYVKKLHEEHGYVFHVITSQSNNYYAPSRAFTYISRLQRHGIG
jgi:FMN phosphatase YigB (HAD superfamily)